MSYCNRCVRSCGSADAPDGDAGGDALEAEPWHLGVPGGRKAQQLETDLGRPLPYRLWMQVPKVLLISLIRGPGAGEPHSAYLRLL